MAADDHKRHAPTSVRVFVLTISDTRTEENDVSGRLAKDLLTQAGHLIAGARILKDEPAEVAALVGEIAAARCADVLVSSGGTGISQRDATYEALTGIFEKRIDGFGELFRMLSYTEIGAAAMLSRAVAGLYRGLVVFALPGSAGAVRLGLEKLILPELGHLAFEKGR